MSITAEWSCRLMRGLLKTDAKIRIVPNTGGECLTAHMIIYVAHSGDPGATQLLHCATWEWQRYALRTMSN